MADTYSNQVEAVIIKLEQQVSAKTAGKMLTRVSLHLMGKLDKYPPSTQANHPNGVNGYSWYVRGFGTRTRTGRAYQTSERFNSRWKSRRAGGFKRVLDNNTTYGGYLIGDRQVSWAKARGWVEMAKVLREEQDEIGEIVREEIAKVNRGRS